MGTVTVGLDIGTTSTKAVAVDDEGVIVARCRVPHDLLVPSGQRLEHDAGRAWRRGPRRALAALGDVRPQAIAVTAMVPSIAAVDQRGRPLTAGVLYGDERGRDEAGEMAGFVGWAAATEPGAHGYWPAQAVSNRALGAPPAVDLAVAYSSSPLYGVAGWDQEICERLGVDPRRLPQVEPPGAAVGRAGRDGPVITAASVDVWCEQLCAGATEPGDVHVICGTTLIVWAVTAAGATPGGLWAVPHADPQLHMVGGASNAGGLFIEWSNRLIGQVARGERLDPAAIPIWTPYLRGERTPYHDPSRRAALHGLDLTHGPGAVRRAAWEATGFVVRHHLDLGGVRARRIVATGGGTRVDGWMGALADATGLPVHVAAFPEGAAVGAAFLARAAAGLESDVSAASRWARTGRVVEPDPSWEGPAAERYRRFRELSGEAGQ